MASASSHTGGRTGGAGVVEADATVRDGLRATPRVEAATVAGAGAEGCVEAIASKEDGCNNNGAGAAAAAPPDALDVGATDNAAAADGVDATVAADNAVGADVDAVVSAAGFAADS